MSTNNAPNASTFDLSPPRRPTANDFNGAAKIDDGNFQPDPQTMPSAAEYNTLCLLHAALGKVAPVAVLSVAGGVSPSITQFVCAGSLPVIGTFTVTRVSAGNVQITWPANTFPPSVAQPKAYLNGSTCGMITCSPITNGIQVYTFNTAGTATDLSFTADVL